MYYAWLFGCTFTPFNFYNLAATCENLPFIRASGTYRELQNSWFTNPFCHTFTQLACWVVVATGQRWTTHCLQILMLGQSLSSHSVSGFYYARGQPSVKILLDSLICLSQHHAIAIQSFLKLCPICSKNKNQIIVSRRFS